MDLYLKAKIKNPPEQVGFQWPCGISVNCFQDKKNADPGSAFVSALFKGRWWRGSFRGSWKGLAGGGGTVMRGQLSPQNTSTGADSRPKMPGQAHRLAIYKNRERVSELSLIVPVPDYSAIVPARAPTQRLKTIIALCLFLPPHPNNCCGYCLKWYCKQMQRG